GLAITPALGSVATHTRSFLGGLDGGLLVKGDRLPLRGPPPAGLPFYCRPAPAPPRENVARVILGPQADRFTTAGIAAFLAGHYTATARQDRMGCQFDGPRIEHSDGFNIVSDGIANGSIQVPGNGLPV